ARKSPPSSPRVSEQARLFAAPPRDSCRAPVPRRKAMRECANLRGTMTSPPAGPPEVPPLLAARRTVRFYRPAPVPEAVVRALLESAASAPTAHNAQPVRYVVIGTPALRRRLAERMAVRWRRDLERGGAPKAVIGAEPGFSL